MKMNPVVHFEMPAEDKQRMSDFYSKTFGWQTKAMGPEMGSYIVVTTSESDPNDLAGRPKAPGTINGGFFQKSNETSNAPQIVIAVDDMQESMRNVNEGGGKVLGEPTDIPGVGLYVAFTDTEGNRAVMLQPKGM